ncbi:MAG: hypothetical protein H6830_05625 [Planctomycetes bacterium]|nr:hypothetical protein [Planctomycetota bacterium]MCB9909003.1 hypothetical protein [Planctomycetota bacterium]MCB9911752.1 hypothetical protein [Planctomycetota bacterium]HPF15424.1 hypothetical protein [Planctomycetota bacterium]HRV80012.1 hypothetical protein [Planctomycetota bacterium]
MNRPLILSLLLALPLFACKGPQGAQDVAPYPLNTCLVTGNELGSMGDAYVIIYEGQEVKLCCQSCEDEFRADPAKFMDRLHKAKR